MFVKNIIQIKNKFNTYFYFLGWTYIKGEGYNDSSDNLDNEILNKSQKNKNRKKYIGIFLFIDR
jgi:hypothetical protein